VQDHRFQRIAERIRTCEREPRDEGERAQMSHIGHGRRARSSASNDANSGRPT